MDADGNRYLDLVLSWGPLILGHAHPEVLAAVVEAAGRGTTFGAPTELEVRLAERVVATFPSLEMVRFVSSGTEAVMSAVRLARAATSRRLIVKFDGCYHGHADALLAAAGSGVATLGLPDSPGVTAGHRGRHAGRAVQRSRRGRGAVRGAGRGDRRGAGGAGGGQHGGGAAGARVPRRAADAHPASTARCWSSTR